MKGSTVVLIGLVAIAAFILYSQYKSKYGAEKYEGSSNAPNPNIPVTHVGELCSQCIGNCHMRIWANIYKPPEGKSEKEFCTQKCYDICVNFD